MPSQRIAIIDYGMGNLHSATSGLKAVAPDADIQITNDVDLIRSADRVLFPGVGAIGECMKEIKRLNIHTLLAEQIAQKPVLGICIGMQALMSHSEESNGVPCMNLVNGNVLKFQQQQMQTAQPQASNYKIPHMGWNKVKQTNAHPLWHGIDDNAFFYFVHSYYVQINANVYETGTSTYGHPFTAAAAKLNLFCTQFHPEKSHDNGLKLLANFCQWQGNF